VITFARRPTWGSVGVAAVGKIGTRPNWALMLKSGNTNPHLIDLRNDRGTFHDDGYFGTGGNNNEYKWRVKNGLLEILNDAGRIFSRFSYDKSKGMFVHTNDPDTLSIRFQTIRPKKWGSRRSGG
jgi:hypothetical protein